MPKRVKTIDLTELSPTCNKISFEINKLDALHLEIETGEVIKSDTEVELFIMKPNNQLVSEIITTISGSAVKVDVKNGALDVAGMAIGRIKLSDSDGIVSTAPFYFTINDSFTNDDAIVNEVGIGAIEKLKKQIDNAQIDPEVLKNKIEETINNGGLDVVSKEELQGINSQLEQINKLKKLSTDLYSKFQYKLRRTDELLTIIFQGDSTIYGTDTSSVDKRPISETLTDNGVTHKVTRASVTMPEHFATLINSVYSNRITVINKGYSGDGTKSGCEHWNPGGADLKIFEYGINDASNSNIEYMGNVETFLYYYRKLIEQELLSGTAVIVISPIKQLLVSSLDNESRTAVDVFSNAVMMMCKELNIPYIDGHLLLEGYGAELWADTTHLNGEGNKVFATKLLPPFVGEGAHKPYKINGYDMLGSNPLLDNFKLINGAQIIKNSAYPTPDEFIANGGNAIYLKDGNKVMYSFYCEQPNMVVVPSLYSSSSNCKIKVTLDNGIKQARYQNYFYGMDTIPVDFSYCEPSQIIIANDDLIDYANKCYTLRNLQYTTDPKIIITNRGWHTITIETEFSNAADSCTFYGIEFITFNDYLNKTIKRIGVELNNCEIFDEPRTPVLEIDGSRLVYLQGIITNITNIEEPIIKFDSKYAPKVNSTFVVALSNSRGGGYGVVSVTTAGNVYLIYKSIDSANFSTLFGCSWRC